MQMQQIDDHDSQFDEAGNSQHQSNRIENELQAGLVEQSKALQAQTEFERTISQELQDKQKSLQEMIAGKSDEEVLNIRMHQLAVAKILVMTHGKHQFRLVQAHTRLGQAYLNFQCYEQTAEHLQIAKRKSTKMHAELPEIKLYEAFILQLLGKCHIQTQESERALQILTHALEIQTAAQAFSKTDLNKTLVLIASCYTSQKSYTSALEYLKRVELNMETDGVKGLTLASVKAEIARVHALRGNLSEAEQIQLEAIDILVEINYHKPEYVAQQYQVLSGYQEKQGNVFGFLDSLQKIKVIYQQTFGHCHQKVIKSQKKLATALLKNGKQTQSLTELNQILQAQERIYGENSLQAGKTHKFIGNVYLTQHKNLQAINHLKKSLKIHEQNGLKRACDELKKSLQLAKSGYSKRIQI